MQFEYHFHRDFILIYENNFSKKITPVFSQKNSPTWITKDIISCVKECRNAQMYAFKVY